MRFPCVCARGCVCVLSDAALCVFDGLRGGRGSGEQPTGSHAAVRVSRRLPVWACLPQPDPKPCSLQRQDGGYTDTGPITRSTFSS